MIKNDALKRKVVCLHIFESQDNTVDRAKTGIGDKVSVMETRPLSKTVRWRLVEIVEKAK